MNETAPDGEPTPNVLSFGTALHRVRQLRQRAAVLAHLHEVLATRFFPSGEFGGHPEYLVMLGNEPVVVEDDVVDAIFAFFVMEIERVQGARLELEGAAVDVPARVEDAGRVLVDTPADCVVVNPQAQRARKRDGKTPDGHT